RRLLAAATDRAGALWLLPRHLRVPIANCRRQDETRPENLPRLGYLPVGTELVIPMAARSQRPAGAAAARAASVGPGREGGDGREVLPAPVRDRRAAHDRRPLRRRVLRVRPA